jgi:uncharacterized protein (DUF1697 family)
MVVSNEELAAVVAANTLSTIADNPSCLLVGILGDPADREKLAVIARKDWGEERIALGVGAVRAVYMWMPSGVATSKLNAAISKALGDGVTARNWSTMLKPQDMAGKGARKLLL